MGKARDLIVRVLGDSRGGQKALGDVGGAADQAQGKLGRAGGIMQGALDKVGLGGTRAAGALGGLNTAIGGSINPAAAAAAGIGAVAAVVAKGVGDFIDLADQVRNFKQLSGASAEESSRFVAVLDDFGISSEKGAAAVFKLGRTLATDKDALKGYGVEVARNADGTTNLAETVTNVADAYANTVDPAKRAELVTKAFGRSGSDLIPILEQGGSQLRKFLAEADGNFQLLSEEELAKAFKLKLALDALTDATSGLSREVGSAAAPALAQLTTVTADLITKTDTLFNKVGGLSAVVSTAFDVVPIGPLIKGYDELTGATDKAKTAAEKKAAADIEGKRAEQEKTEEVKIATEAYKAEEKAINDVITAQLGVINADIRVENAARATARAKEDAAAAFDKVTEAGGKNKEINEANTEAVQKLKETIVAEAGAVQFQAEQQAIANGKALDAAEAQEVFKAKLLEVAATLAPGNALRVELEGYAAGIKGIPEARQTVVDARFEASAVEEGYERLARKFAEPVTIPVKIDMAAVEADFRQAERDFANRPLRIRADFDTSGAEASLRALERRFGV